MNNRERKSKNKFFSLVCLATALFIGSTVQPLFPAVPQGAKKPNVLLITLDTMRCDRIGAYNDHFAKTPNIDRIAGQGVLFTRAFAHNPMTLPSHVNILTGTTPLYHGISNNTNFRLDKTSLTLAEYLKKRGYHTAAYIGSFVLSKYFGLDQGFDQYREPTEKDEFIAAEVLGPAGKWINAQQQPWFCWVHLWDPHSPYTPPEPYASRYAKDPYSGEVAYVDAQLGNFFKELEKNKKLDHTVVVITGDHGESLGDHGEHEHGYFAYNSTIHIPLIIYGPGVNIPAKKIDSNVCHTDIFPTICDILNKGGKAQDTPPHLQGQSLLPLIQNPKGQPGAEATARVIYFESKGPYLDKGWAPLEGYIQGDRKFIDQPIKELYDIAKDYEEKNNIISGVRISTLLGTLRQAKTTLTAKDKQTSKADVEPAVLQKLRTFGYLAGFKQEKKTVFSRQDDLKVLLPIQNMIRKAAQLVNRAQYDEALKLYTAVLKKRPDNVSSYVFSAEIYSKTGRPTLAIETLQAGLKQKPDNLELKSRLGVIFTEINKVDEGIKILQDVLSKEDVNAEAWNYLGVAYYKKGMFGKAIEAYTKAIGIDKNYDLPYNNLGTLYLSRFLKTRDSREHRRAVDYFKQAISCNPRLASAYNGLGAAYKFSNQKQEAIAAWQKALENKPDFIDVYFNLGILLIETGQKAQARQYLNTCKQKYSSRLRDRDKAQLDRLISQTY